MNTTLSQKHLLDITMLRNPFQSGPWDISFSEHLAGFSDAIDLCQTIHGAPTEDGENFGLSDAAYVLSSAGTLWSKRVDDTSTAAKTTLNSLNDVSKAKKKKGSADDKDKPMVVKRGGHPLALPFDIAKDDTAKFLDTREKTKSSGNYTVDKLPLLSQDSYLSPTYPHLLPLLDCERIKPYLDDGKKVKGVDWAEFKINVLLMNVDGYYPLSTERSASKSVSIEYRNFTPSEVAEFSPDPLEIVDMNYDEETVINHDDNMQADQQADTNVRESSKKDNSIPSNENETSFITKENQSNVPFDRLYHINQRFAARNDVVADVPVVENPYRRRNKRVMKEKAVAPVSGEVEFFMNFWAFPDKELPYMDLAFVIKRYRFRVHAVQLDLVSNGKRGAKKKNVEKSVVQFVSQDAEDETVLAEIVSAPMDKETREAEGETEDIAEPIFSHFAEDDRENYEDLDEPVGGEEALQLDAAIAEDFDRMVKATRTTKLNDVLVYADGPDSSSSTDCSFVAESDLQAWEVRLSSFLAVHEKATMSFDLEKYGKSLMQKCGSERSRSVIDIVRSNEVGRNSENICRTFLSLLDLANKKSVEFDSAGDGTGSSSQERVSEDVTQVKMRFNAQ